VGVMATLLDTLSNKSTRVKSSVQKGALVRNRRALRSAPDKLGVLITTTLSQASSSQAPLIFVPLIGLAVDVMIRLKHVKNESWTHLSIDVRV
jgi:predicted amino acid dehydrogenase